MPNPYTFIPNALPQGQMQRIYAEVGSPAPTSFADPMVLISPDWSPDIALAAVAEWPADHGTVLPVVGDQVLLEQDSRGFWRVASWGHATTSWAFTQTPVGLAFGTNWSNYGSVYQQGSYLRDQLGWVNVRGLVKKGTAYSNGDVIATLPVGFRPAANAAELFTGQGFDSVMGGLVARVDVNVNGTIVLANTTPTYSTPGLMNYLSLSGIRFQQGA